MVYTLFAFGRERRIALTSVADGLLTAGGALVLVRVIGLEGAPLASLIGVCAVSIPLHLRALTRDLSIRMEDVFAWREWCWRFLIAAAASLAIGLAIGKASFVQAAIGATLATGIYLLLTFRPVLDSPLGPYLVDVAPAWTRRFFRASGEPAGV